MSEKHKCRCPSCGYVHEHIDAVKAAVEIVPEAVPVIVAAPPEAQAVRCPLCGYEISGPDAVAVYTKHRAENCAIPAPPPPADPPADPPQDPPADPPGGNP